MSRVGRALSLGVIRVYQVTMGPVFGLFSQCRYHPTCSRYGYEAIRRHGVRRGWWMALRRLARCGPWGDSGWDPVPEEYVSWREARRRKHAARSAQVADVADQGGMSA